MVNEDGLFQKTLVKINHVLGFRHNKKLWLIEIRSKRFQSPSHSYTRGGRKRRRKHASPEKARLMVYCDIPLNTANGSHSYMQCHTFYEKR